MAGSALPSSSPLSFAPPTNLAKSKEQFFTTEDDSYLFSQSLSTSHIGRHFVSRGVVDSTMEIASREAKEGAPHGTIVVARQQTQGRGRGGRPWVSHEGNLYVTFLLRPKEMKSVFKINLSMALACVMTATEMGVKEATIKWPNDVWVCGKKLSGYILDTSMLGKELTCLVGVGLNVNEDMRQHEDAFFRENATSLLGEIGSEFSRYSVLAHLCNNLEFFLSMDMGEVLEKYKERSLLLGKRVTIKPKRREDPEGYEAEAIGLNDTGMLIIRLDDGKEKVVSGEEVMVRLPEYNKSI